ALAEQHVGHCAVCRDEIRSLQNVDSLVQQVFRYRLVEAQVSRVPKRSMGFGLALTGGALAAAAVLALTVLNPKPQPPSPAPIAAKPVEERVVSTEPVLVKGSTSQTAEATRSKPEPARDEVRPQPSSPAPVPPGAPAFAVIDPAGYSTTLASYRG